MTEASLEDRPEGDQVNHTVTGKRTLRRKRRPTYSCLNCHKRKVKCDRIKPCGACVLRGTPLECDYGISKRDRKLIENATLIEKLMRAHENLQQQLAEARRLDNSFFAETEGRSILNKKSHETRREWINRDDEDPREALGISKENDNRLSSLIKSTSSAQNCHNNKCQRKSSLFREQHTLAYTMENGVFREFCVNLLVENFNPVNISGTFPLRGAKDMRLLSPILSEAFEAASLTFVGRLYHNKSLDVAGHAKYIIVIRLLQKALNGLKSSQSTDVLLAVLLCTIVESLRKTNVTSTLKHELGGLALLQTRSPYRHRHGIERSLFIDLRQFWITASLVNRKPTFLSSIEWLTIPWSFDGPPKDILQQLLDVATHIPGYLAQIDGIQKALKDPAISESELWFLQSTASVRAHHLKGMLDAWKCTFADTHRGGGPHEESSIGINHSEFDIQQQFPIFRCRDQCTMQIISATNLVYPDTLLVTSMCYYWALNLIISASSAGVDSPLSPQERYQYACQICRSIKYYTSIVPGCLVSRVMFVLRTACDTFSDGMEKNSISEMIEYIDHRLAFASEP